MGLTGPVVCKTMTNLLRSHLYEQFILKRTFNTGTATSLVGSLHGSLHGSLRVNIGSRDNYYHHTFTLEGSDSQNTRISSFLFGEAIRVGIFAGRSALKNIESTYNSTLYAGQILTSCSAGFDLFGKVS